MKNLKNILKKLVPPKKRGEALKSVLKNIDGATAIKLAKKKVKDNK